MRRLWSKHKYCKHKISYDFYSRQIGVTADAFIDKKRTRSALLGIRFLDNALALVKLGPVAREEFYGKGLGINWNDAKAYVTWLAKKTGIVYRLLTEAE